MTRYFPMRRGFLIASGFGPRSGGFHAGADFGWPGGSAGLPVYAVAAGTVIYAGAAQGYGGPDPAGWLVIDHPTAAGGGTSEYGHIIREVGIGARVQAGQRIGRINADQSTNGGVDPHCHLSIMPYGYEPTAKLDPLEWLKGAAFPNQAPASPPPPAGGKPMTFRTAYGNTHSENGWRMCNRDACDIADVPMIYIDTAPLRRGAPQTILGAWLLWYDRNIDTEVNSPVWGWSNTNDVANSNHLSGTALDINAPLYPWGSRVMPRHRIDKIREGLRLFEGTVFWGADWQRADEMHFQMAFREGDARNEAFAAKLRSGHLGLYKSTSTPPATGGFMSALSDAEQRQLFDAFCRPRKSLVEGSTAELDAATFIQCTDAATYRTEREVAALRAQVAELLALMKGGK